MCELHQVCQQRHVLFIHLPPKRFRLRIGPQQRSHTPVCRWARRQQMTSPNHVPTLGIHSHRYCTLAAYNWSYWRSTNTANEQNRTNQSNYTNFIAIADLQSIAMAQRPANRSGNIATASFLSSDGYSLIGGVHRRTMQWRSFGRRPRT